MKLTNLKKKKKDNVKPTIDGHSLFHQNSQSRNKYSQLIAKEDALSLDLSDDLIISPKTKPATYSRNRDLRLQFQQQNQPVYTHHHYVNANIMYAG